MGWFYTFMNVKLLFNKNILEICIAIGAVIFFIALMTLTNIITIEGIWFVFLPYNIRITTIATIIFCFALVLFLQGKLGWRPLYYAILSVIFFLGLYEIIWYQMAAHFFNYDLRIFEFAALAGWVLLCIREVYPKKLPRLSLALYGFFFLTMILWVATGFDVNSLGNATFSITGEGFNVSSKAALALAYAVHIGVKKQPMKISKK